MRIGERNYRQEKKRIIYLCLVISISINKILHSGSSVICQNHSKEQHFQPCDHEEADTRIVLHLYDAVCQGAQNILVSVHSRHGCDRHSH